MPPAQPIDLLELQRLAPSEMRTAEWSMVDQWTRERSFYMAGVTRSEVLHEMQEMVRQHAEGEAGEYELRQRWEEFLDGIGYTPEPGTEGSLQDLRSLRRFNVALRTNLALIHEWASKEAALRPGPLRAQPAFELIRLNQPRVPRDWPERWEAAGGEFYAAPGTSVARMIAPKLSPVWPRLGSRELFGDALGVDYPPFAWGSGKGRVGVGAREVMELGVMTREDILAQLEEAAGRPVHSPNEALETRPRVLDPELRERLADDLGGLAKWDGDVLVHTDPNGTRPMTPAELAETWIRPLPAPFATPEHPEGQIQRDTVLDLAADPAAFARREGREHTDHLARAIGRLVESATDRRRIALPADRSWVPALSGSPLWLAALDIVDVAARAVGIVRAVRAIL